MLAGTKGGVWSGMSVARGDGMPEGAPCGSERARSAGQMRCSRRRGSEKQYFGAMAGPGRESWAVSLKGVRAADNLLWEKQTKRLE